MTQKVQTDKSCPSKLLPMSRDRDGIESYLSELINSAHPDAFFPSIAIPKNLKLKTNSISDKTLKGLGNCV